MKLHDLRPAEGATKRRKRVGRGIGSGFGKTAGRGSKGQNSRSGGGVRPGFEGGAIPFIRRIPKRGFKNVAFRKEYSVVNVGTLNEFFSDGDSVDADILRDRGIVRKKASFGLKVLGDGELEKRLNVSASKFTKSAKEKIEKAGGTAFEAAQCSRH